MNQTDRLFVPNEPLTGKYRIVGATETGSRDTTKWILTIRRGGESHRVLEIEPAIVNVDREIKGNLPKCLEGTALEIVTSGQFTVPYARNATTDELSKIDAPTDPVARS